MPTQRGESHNHAYSKRRISSRSLGRWAAVPPLPPLTDNSLNSAHAETYNGVVAMTVATNNHSNNNSNDVSDDDIPAAELAKQAVIGARQLAAMNRDWTVEEEDPDLSGGNPDYFDK